MLPIATIRCASIISLSAFWLTLGCGDDGDGPSSSNGSGGGSAMGGMHSGNGGDGPVDCDTFQDPCPVATGLTYQCAQRFALGINYAWHHFAGDFGGIGPWSQQGVSQQSSVIDAELAEMRANGVSVIRWWMFPDFRGDGVEFAGGSQDPTGISEGAVADIHEALALAESNDVYLVLTIFSFDNFRPTRDEHGIHVPGMSDMVRDDTRRATLIENVVRPVASAVASSSHAHRLLGWDVINEPEWAIQPTGTVAEGQDFDPNDDELDVVTLAEMKAFINESLTVLRQETPHALLSVGWAAAKWVWAFDDITNVDFHQPHIYGWVNEWWPYTSTPAELGYTGKPTVMGEYYLVNMPFSDRGNDSTFQQINQSWFENGYAGSWPWQYNEEAANLPLIQAFASDKECSVSF